MKIAAVGDNCMDVYENLGKAFPGGNPVNVAVYSVRLGGEASYTGVVGNDKYGKIMIDALNAKGVDTSHVKVLPGNTAITQVELIDGERVFGDYDEGVLAQFKLSDEDIEFLCSQDMVVTGLWGKIENDLYKIKAKGTPIAFDFANKLDDPVIEKAIYHVDYAFFASDDGDTDFIRNYMKKMHAKGPKIVTVTLGDKGSIAYDGEKFTTFGIVPCDVKDTMGAGDSYIAGFLRGILQGKELKECMHMGAANSSITLQYNGAW
ncbi:fructoselysine 6-kinase [Caproiciproducens galactitolivorans]|uniref:Fructoselysine kinase n=1 Tax=Caproiciproducens galactitolivorans TaxID=642589 RepID=A0A4Z0YEX7_9FIRM|nr:fructoselysine 6-kinase [Caproiciproducens galactitolivorans]QEY33818.1 fructoselysine 6-kinase [Caproiciproducens galactitolivorans]TGJ75512.1 fructoselysine kinase [Caproiciproducens galactitolivorans]